MKEIFYVGGLKSREDILALLGSNTEFKRYCQMPEKKGLGEIPEGSPIPKNDVEVNKTRYYDLGEETHY